METAVLRLRELGISPSPQRTAVFDYLLTHKTHPTAAEIYKELKPAMPTISLTTVYNVLKLLSSSGAVRTVLIEEGELRYDADLSEHAHAKCTVCGKIWDLFPEPGKLLFTGNVPLPPGFQPVEQHLDLLGVCGSCSQKH